MGRPKQMLPLAGKPALVHTIAAFKQVPQVRQIVVVTAPENFPIVQTYFTDLVFTAPGDTRMESVKKGFACVAPAAELVAVHDGARPLVSPQYIADCLMAAQTYGAAVLAVPVKDTVKVASEQFVSHTLDRSTLWAAQTPQVYRREILQRALEQFGDLSQATDESQLVEKTGVRVRLVASDYKNNKITTPEDLLLAQALMEQQTIYRTGFGFDLHRLEAGRKLFIGGVEIAHSKGFLGRGGNRDSFPAYGSFH